MTGQRSPPAFLMSDDSVSSGLTSKLLHGDLCLLRAAPRPRKGWLGKMQLGFTHSACYGPGEHLCAPRHSYKPLWWASWRKAQV